jgi:hypothetical protein
MTQAEFLLQMAEHLETTGIPFLVAGSHSSSFHSHPRTTNDVDLVIAPTAVLGVAEKLEVVLRNAAEQQPL